MITLFDDYKNQLVTSPLLLRYNSSKPVFLKIDWPAGGMGYILMQDNEYPQSLVTLTVLDNTGECTFDFPFDGSRLRHVSFGSCSNRTFEVHYHSFVDEVACGRWTFSCYRKYLWGRSSTGSVIILQFRKYLSIAEVFTKFDVGPRNSLNKILISSIISQAR